MPCFYLTPKQDNFNQIPELQVCIAEALYDAEAVLSNPVHSRQKKSGPYGIRSLPTSSGRGRFQVGVRTS